MPSLLDMPDLAMEKILEKCDFVSMVRLRKTCHSLRNFIDDKKPLQNLRILEISQISKTGLSMELRFLYNWDWHVKLEYEKMDMDYCSIKWIKSDDDDETVEKIVEKNFLETFLQDFKILINLQKATFEQFWMKFQAESDFFIEKVLKSKLDPLKVKTLSISGTHESQVLQILPYLCPESLKGLEVVGIERLYGKMDISEIVKLEQWKKAKILEMKIIEVLAPISNFENFEVAKILINDVTPKMIFELKKLFQHSKTMKCFQLHYEDFEDDSEFCRIFEYGGDQLETFFEENGRYFKIKHDSEKVVGFYWHVYMFEFRVIPISSVPKNARIID